MLTTYRKKQIRDLYKGKIKVDFIINKFNITKKELLEVVNGVATRRPSKEELIRNIKESIKEYGYTLSEISDIFDTPILRAREAVKEINLLFEDLVYERKLDFIKDARSNIANSTLRRRYFLSNKEIKKIRETIVKVTSEIDGKINSNTKEILIAKKRLKELLSIEKENDSTLKSILKELVKNKK